MVSVIERVKAKKKELPMVSGSERVKLLKCYPVMSGSERVKL